MQHEYADVVKFCRHGGFKVKMMMDKVEEGLPVVFVCLLCSSLYGGSQCGVQLSLKLAGTSSCGRGVGSG